MGKIKNKSKPLQALIAALFAVLLACTPAIAMADMVGIDVSGWQDANVTCTASYDFAVVKVSQGCCLLPNCFVFLSNPML